MAEFYLKDPSARLDYHLDWNAGLLGGAAIATSVWRVEPQEDGGLQVDSADIADGIASVHVSQGRPGCVYRLSNRIDFADGRADERTLVIRVEER